MAPHDSIFNHTDRRESLNAGEHVLTSQTKGLALGLTLGDGSRVVHNGSLNQEMEAWLCEMAADEREVPWARSKKRDATVIGTNIGIWTATQTS